MTAVRHLTQLRRSKKITYPGMGDAKHDPNERARQYRARAEECLRLTECGTLPDFKVEYLRHVAQCYLELALAEENRAGEQRERIRRSVMLYHSVWVMPITCDVCNLPAECLPTWNIDPTSAFGSRRIGVGE